MRSTVLFVDDEPFITAAQKRSLRKEPYLILTAQSGKEALEIMSRQNVDVVVSDEQMPGMEGSALLSIVHGKYPEIVTIILTGQARLGSAIRAINEADVFRFLLKPCSEEEMAMAIRTALQHKHLLVESRRLLAAARQQSSILQVLERENPGITQVTTDDAGTILLEDEQPVSDVNRLIRQLNEQATLSEEMTRDTGQEGEDCR